VGGVYSNSTTPLFVSPNGSASGPTGIAFDGNDLWIANWNTDTVARHVLATGLTVHLVVGDKPFGIVYDGSRIWVTNYGSDTVTALVP